MRLPAIQDYVCAEANRGLPPTQGLQAQQDIESTIRGAGGQKKRRAVARLFHC